MSSSSLLHGNLYEAVYIRIDGVMTRELQTDMKIANSYENCKPIWKLQMSTYHTRKSENCKLIWKLQTDMKIANWYENCQLIWKLQSNSHVSMFGSYVDVCNFHMRDTPGLKTCSGKEFLGWIDDKNSQGTISCKTFHDSYSNTNSCEKTVWFIF